MPSNDETIIETPVEGAEPAPPAAPPAEPAAEAAPPAAPAPPAEAAKPEIGTAEWIDDPATPPEALREYLDKVRSGEIEPEPVKAEEEAVAEEAAPAAEAAPPADDFKFTEDADEETFAKEAAEYLETVEVTPQLQTILDRQKADIERLAGEVATASTANTSDAEMSQALDALATWDKKDPQTGQHVPNTDGLIGYLEKNFKNELPQVIIDINSRPSDKYAGATLLQEFIHDNFDLDAEAMTRLDRFFETGGQFDVPAFVPEGINEKLAEAFWMAADREEIVEKVDRAYFTLNTDPDATAADKLLAQQTLADLNTRLSQVQSGIDAKNAQIQANKQLTDQNRIAVRNEAVDRFMETTGAILDDVGREAAKGLDFLGDGAELTGVAIGSLLENCLSDNSGFAKRAQDKVAKLGVKINWAEAFAVRDEVFDADEAIVNLEKQRNVNPRAMENAKKIKNTAVKELQGLAKQAAGQINAKMTKGAGAKLAEEIKTAPRIPAARPKTNGAGTKAVTKADYDKMPVEDIRKQLREMRQNPYAAAARGDLSAFE